jgi:hypothetical protein
MALGITSASLEAARERRHTQDASVAKDLALAIPRGIEGTIQSVYQLGDWATGDLLPDYDSKFLGTSETITGGLAEGIAQFAAGFIPIAGQIGKVAQGAKWGSRLLRTSKTGKQVLNWKGMVAAEVTTDFVAFRAQEERLSNLVQMFPALENPLTDFLAADDDDGELEGRFKNSLEGLGITGLLAPILLGVSKGVKAARRGNTKVAKDEVNKVAPLMRSLGGNEKGYHGGKITDPEIKELIGATKFEKYDEDSLILIEDMNALQELPEGAGKADVGQVLEALSSKGSDEYVRGWSESFRRLFEDDADFLRTPIRTVADSSSLGSFDPIGAEDFGPIVRLHTNRRAIREGTITSNSTFQETTLLHEVVHAAVGLKLPTELTSVGKSQAYGHEYLAELDLYLQGADPSEGAFKLVSAYRQALDNIDPTHKGLFEHLNDTGSYVDAVPSARKDIAKWYGLTNLDEFVAEALTNKQFQTFLKGIKGTDKATLWDNVVDFFKSVFGAEAKGTLMDDTINGFTDLITKVKDRNGLQDYYDFGRRDNVMPSRTAGQHAKRQKQKAVAKVKSAFDEIKLGQDKSRGGQVAIEGASKSIKEATTSDDIDELIKQGEEFMAEQLEATPKLDKEALKVGGIHQAVQRLSEVAGINSDILASEVAAAGEDANALRRIAARLFTVESLATAQADEVWESAKKFAALGAGASDIDKANVVGELKKMVELITAGTKIRRGFGQGLRSTQFDRAKLKLSELELRETDIVDEFLANNTNKKFNEIINTILTSHDPKDSIASLLGISKAARLAEPKGFMEKAQNLFVNSLLSGPRTMVKNGIGNSVALTLLNVETAVGGAMVNPAITSQVLKEFFTFDSFRESLQYFLKVWNSKEQLLDIGRSPLENTKKTRIPLLFEQAPPEATFKSALNWIGDNIINAPTKTLSAMDEVFKQAMFRQRAKLELSMKAMKSGLKDPEDIAEYVTRGMDGLLVNGERAWSNAGVIKHAHAKAREADAALVKGGQSRMKPSERGEYIRNIVETETKTRTDLTRSFEEGGLGIDSLADLDTLSANALEKARYATFTNDAGKAAELAGGLVKTMPALKFVFPFIRTPINLIKFSLDRATFAGPESFRHVMAYMPDLPILKQTQAKIRDEVLNRDPLVKADALGKMATSIMINTSLISMIYANRDLLSGGGPKDISQKKTLEATGWQPYSVKIGNKYYSYGGLDPIGMHFGILVDIVDQMDDLETANTGAVETVLTAAMISMTRNITDKSYLAGLKFLTDALSEPDRKLERGMQNIAAGFVPNILYQGQSLTGDTSIREARSVADAILKKLPNGGQLLDPKRNLMGEPIIKENVPFIGPFNPAAISTRDNDAVFEELASLQHGFSNPSHILDGVLDLTSHSNEEGQTAHDRRLELMGSVKIGNKTMRQALEKVIRSKKYQSLSKYSDGGFKSPRVDVLNKVMGKYRTVALSKMMREFPDLRSDYDNLKSAEKLAQRGASADVLSSLLQF